MMTNENDEKDIFIAEYKYPDAKLIFNTKIKSLEEVKKDCIVVLDTNVLLAPYSFSEEKSMKNFDQEFRKICTPLIAQKRLKVPAQVAREFAKNRTEKLQNLQNDLSERKKKVQVLKIKTFDNSLLNSLPSYKELLELNTQIDTLYSQSLDEKLREYETAIDKVLDQLKKWLWDDPISLLYRELFNDDVVYEPSPAFDKATIERNLAKRYLHNIPPGFKDKAKEDKGVGDFIIWLTILQLGEMLQKDIIFVTGEEKKDWWVKSGKNLLFARYELIYEFMHHSKGKSFHIVKYPRFLELFGADPEVVEELQKEEALQEQPLALKAIVLTKRIGTGTSTRDAYRSEIVDQDYGVSTGDITGAEQKNDGIEHYPYYGMLVEIGITKESLERLKEDERFLIVLDSINDSESVPDMLWLNKLQNWLLSRGIPKEDVQNLLKKMIGMNRGKIKEELLKIMRTPRTEVHNLIERLEFS